MAEPLAASASAYASADVVTEAPERYAKQLASHLGRRCTVEEDDGVTRIHIGAGQCELRCVPGVLQLRAAASSPDDLDRVQQVVGSHLERFGRRGELVVSWQAGDRPDPGA